MFYNVYSGYWEIDWREARLSLEIVTIRLQDPSEGRWGLGQGSSGGGRWGGGDCFRLSGQGIFPSFVNFPMGARMLIVRIRLWNEISHILCWPLSVIWGKQHNFSMPWISHLQNGHSK